MPSAARSSPIPPGPAWRSSIRGNNGLYAVIDQQLYRPKGGDSQSGISVFSRMSISPSDRNLISAYIDGGIVFAGLIPQRPADKFGASVIYAKFSDSVRAFDRDTVLIDRGAYADPRLRSQSRTQLCGTNRSRLDRAAEPAIHLAPERRRQQERHCDRRALDLAILKALLQLEVGRVDHLGPLLGVVGDELAEFGR